jgi:hypothetical protein
MGLKDTAKKAAASLAVATTGLSSCKNGGGIGAVDPPPPPFLNCPSVAAGQSLVPTATITGDAVNVTIRQLFDPLQSWVVSSVDGVTGATLSNLVLPATARDSLRFRLTLPPTGTTASVTVRATLTDFGQTTCSIARTFIVTRQGNAVTIARSAIEQLPLEARDRAEITVVGRDGNRIALAALTTWLGPRESSWEVTGGTLAPAHGDQVWWSLPDTPGVHQVELTMDYGSSGFAFDVLAIEVT